MIEKSTIPRCPHSVYSPDGDGKPAKYCYGCFPPEPLTDEEKLLVSRMWKTEQFGITKCPECNSNRFKYINDWSFKCLDCGFNELS